MFSFQNSTKKGTEMDINKNDDILYREFKKTHEKAIRNFDTQNDLISLFTPTHKEIIHRKLIHSDLFSHDEISASKLLLLILFHYDYITFSQIEALKIFSSESVINVTLNRLRKPRRELNGAPAIVVTKHSKGFSLYSLSKEQRNAFIYKPGMPFSESFPDAYIKTYDIKKAPIKKEPRLHDIALHGYIYSILADDSYPEFTVYFNMPIPSFNSFSEIKGKLTDYTFRHSFSSIPKGMVLADAVVLPKDKDEIVFVEQDMMTETEQMLEDKFRCYGKTIQDFENKEKYKIVVPIAAPGELHTGRGLLDTVLRLLPDIKSYMEILGVRNFSELYALTGDMISETNITGRRIKAFQELLSKECLVSDNAEMLREEIKRRKRENRPKESAAVSSEVKKRTALINRAAESNLKVFVMAKTLLYNSNPL